jgi:hypothetical protein
MGWPILALFARVGRDAADSIITAMPRDLHRHYGVALYHVFLLSRLPNLRTAQSRDRFLYVLNQFHQRFG